MSRVDQLLWRVERKLKVDGNFPESVGSSLVICILVQSFSDAQTQKRSSHQTLNLTVISVVIVLQRI